MSAIVLGSRELSVSISVFGNAKELLVFVGGIANMKVWQIGAKNMAEIDNFAWRFCCNCLQFEQIAAAERERY